jgi:hypothetical protein
LREVRPPELVRRKLDPETDRRPAMVGDFGNVLATHPTNREEAKTAEMNSVSAWQVAPTIGVLGPRTGIEPISGGERNETRCRRRCCPCL